MTTVNTIPLNWYLLLAAALFCIGIYTALSRRNAIGILMGVELMLNAANVNLVAFDRFVSGGIGGQVFTLFVLAIAAAEAAVALAIILNVFDAHDRIDVDRVNSLKG